MKISLHEPKSIANKKPKEGSNDFNFKYEYDKLDIPIKFSGTFLLAKDFIPEMYVHMGFQRPVAFKTVLELEFKDGELISTKNLSELFAKQRNEDPNIGAAPNSPFEHDVKSWINDTFSLEYKSKEKEND